MKTFFASLLFALLFLLFVQNASAKTLIASDVVKACSKMKIEIFDNALVICKERFRNIDELEKCRDCMEALEIEHGDDENCFAKTVNGQAVIRKRFFEKIYQILDSELDKFLKESRE